jgi:hypothetical protein
MLTFEIPKTTQESFATSKDFPMIAAKMFIQKLVPFVTFEGEKAKVGDKLYTIVSSVAPKHPNGYTHVKVKDDSIVCFVSSNYSELYMLGKIESPKDHAHISDFKPFGFWNMVTVKRRGL